ncbi:conserved exported hypothetical protein [Flavobacterium sp. 9AF]|uniref:T9SS type A sorting domain-containing protein n=1 Tax=Flavobacterium sp. 9AF TaxID=2653142 RepID=UPI0012F30F14|nr:T9SS type A sorting domain-containing protein [Flavobacterium sp. 9AF]VXB68301.1 conserved exported hypothetical protein [Flavobacterium sp. 9AF]
MMKKIIFLVLMFSCAFVFAQNLINNHWKLGQTDLNFSNATPTAVVTNNANYAYATASDSNGNVLFSTNGVDVWDKNNNIMYNGDDILQGLIVSNGYNDDILNTIIVQNLGNINQYYIFTSYNISCLCNTIFPTKYVYSIVEFNASYPNGYVVDLGNQDLQYGTTTFTKFLQDANGASLDAYLYYGSLTATKASDDNSWVVVQYKNKMLSYKIDIQGLNTVPVESTFSNNQIYSPSSWNSSQGTLTGNKGEKIRVAPNTNFLIGLEYSETNDDPAQSPFKFYKLDFNVNTGAFSNYQVLSGYGYRIYDFEISNDSQKLYYVRNQFTNIGQNVNGQVLVKDLTNNATPVRVLNEYLASTTPTSQFGYIQKDRKGNILLTSYATSFNKNKYVHKIENQDSFSTSTVNINIVYLNGFLISRLPQLIPELDMSTCDQTLVLNSETNANFTYINYEGIISQTNYNLNASNNITMLANSSILLKAGTTISLGANFLARIQPCDIYVSKAMKNSNALDNSFDEPIERKNHVLLYPNPNNGNFTIDLPTYKIGIRYNLSILDLSGKLVYQKGYKSDKINILLQDIEKGIYFLKLIAEDGSLVFEQKFIKQ